jgi:hypothetical protein
VHAAAAVLLRLCGRANVLDYRAVGDVLVGGLRGSFRGGGLGCRCGLADESLQDGLLVWTLAEDLDEVRSRAWLRHRSAQPFAGAFCCQRQSLGALAGVRSRLKLASSTLETGRQLLTGLVAHMVAQASAGKYN